MKNMNNLHSTTLSMTSMFGATVMNHLKGLKGLAVAVAAGWRVRGFVTAVPSFKVVVAAAARAISTYGSAARFCESTTPRPSQPSSSAWRAWRTVEWGKPTPEVQSSIAGLDTSRS